MSPAQTAPFPKETVKATIADGKALAKEGKTKVEITAAMFQKLKGADRETVVAAFKEDHQIAFLIAVVFGAGMGIYIGLRQVELPADSYWLHVGLWGVGGVLLAGIGAFIRQLMRNRRLN